MAIRQKSPKVMQRQTVENSVAIIISALSWVTTMPWYVKFLSIVICCIVAYDCINRSRWTVNLSRIIKVALFCLAAILLVTISWPAIYDQWEKDTQPEWRPQKAQYKKEKPKPTSKPSPTQYPIAQQVPVKSSMVLNAPHGIAIGGGNVNNPTVNNFVPPPRRIPAAVRDELIAILAKKPMEVQVESIVNDPEAFQYAQDWYDIMKAAGWKMKDPVVRVYMVGGGPPDVGVVIRMKGEPIKPGQFVSLSNDDPGLGIAQCMKLLNLSPIARRSLDMPDGFFSINVGPRPQQGE